MTGERARFDGGLSNEDFLVRSAEMKKNLYACHVLEAFKRNRWIEFKL
jgi:hypothetical protein